MTLFTAAGLIGIGYMANDLTKKLKPRYYNPCSIKETIKKNVCKKIDAYFESTSRPKRRYGRVIPRINHADYSGNNVKQEAPGVDVFMYKTRSDAENTMDRLSAFLECYGQVSVSDYYEANDTLSHSEHTDFLYGWRSLDDFEIVDEGAYYIIDFPEPERLR